MTQLIEVTHPLTGKPLRMHPDLLTGQIRWLHPDPTVPTPAESLPLFELAEVDKFVKWLVSEASLTPDTQPLHSHKPTSKGKAGFEKVVSNAR